MSTRSRRLSPPLPAGLRGFVKSAVLTISLAHYTTVAARGQAADLCDARRRCTRTGERRDQELPLLREEIRIKDARMPQIPALRRPRYRPTERLAILELKATHGWSLMQTASRFLVTPATISAWQRRIDKDGPDALLALPRPVNKFPQFVG
ncbi:MAG: helix-turn-helix domain-containing protein [Pirellulales bacterium]|jgi:hypothetical protein